MASHPLIAAPASGHALYPQQNIQPSQQQQQQQQQQVYGPPAAPLFANRMNYDVWKDMLTNQQVEVRLVGHGWVIGIALTCMRFFDVISGLGSRVMYRLPGTRDNREGVFPMNDVRPFNA
ncbi:hypothetical protein BKA70DRAFT_712249 [Coprinopsis sp. MPI-PUGE-AT-0042]|nr:hypothetical protein BKA70DRAFT_712249 [Coprinopsis sp. MPI-PUGE-AT-0042]